MKILAIVVILVGLWYVIPHVRRGEYIAPTAIMPGSWITRDDRSGLALAMATPPEGVGWFHFDFWNRKR
jgi:hypothetical protein